MKQFELGPRIRDWDRAPFAARQLQQHVVRQLRNVDGYRAAGDVVEEFEVMAGNLLWSEFW